MSYIVSAGTLLSFGLLPAKSCRVGLGPVGPPTPPAVVDWGEFPPPKRVERRRGERGECGELERAWEVLLERDILVVWCAALVETTM